MILEIAILNIIAGETAAFEANFAIAQEIICSMKGFKGLELQHCLEDQNRYVLLVKWEKTEDHTVGFRTSAEYQLWKKLLHHFYSPFPVAEHYTMTFKQSKK